MDEMQNSEQPDEVQSIDLEAGSRTDYLKSAWVETCLGRTDDLHTRLQAIESQVEQRGHLLDEIVVNEQTLQAAGAPVQTIPDDYEYIDSLHYKAVHSSDDDGNYPSVETLRTKGFEIYQAYGTYEGARYLMRRPRREAHYLCTECGTTDYMQHYAGYACRPADYDGSR